MDDIVDAATRGGGFDPMTEPRYSCVPTFMRAPLVHDPAEVDIALIGVPFDGGVTGIGCPHAFQVS